MNAPAQTTLQQIRTLLQTTMTVVRDLMADKDLRQWERINFEKAAPLFEQLGHREKYQKALDTYRGQSREILREVERLENELNSLALDVKRNALSPARIEALTRRLEEQCRVLQPPLEELQEHCALLLNGQKRLWELLTIPHLLPVVREQKGISEERVNEGYRFFCLINGGPDDNGAGSPLARCQARATGLEQQFKAIETKELPGLAAVVLEHQIYAGIKAADQIKIYIEDFHQYPPAELEEVAAVVRRLERLRQEELSVLIRKLPGAILAVGHALASLGGRAKSLRQLDLLPPFLDHLDLLCTTLGGPFLEDLGRKTRTAGSPLNPATVAAEKVPDFFRGMQGIVRTLKLLLQSLAGQKGITATELRDLAVTVLTTCHTYYGTTENDLARLQNFLTDQLAPYNRPFPHDALHQFLKEVISIYGSRLETYAFHYKLPEFTTAADQNEPGGKMTLGRLVKKIEVWTGHFEVF